jgi:hypothetical protein
LIDKVGSDTVEYKELILGEKKLSKQRNEANQSKKKLNGGPKLLGRAVVSPRLFLSSQWAKTFPDGSYLRRVLSFSTFFSFEHALVKFRFLIEERCPVKLLIVKQN